MDVLPPPQSATTSEAKSGDAKTVVGRAADTRAVVGRAADTKSVVGRAADKVPRTARGRRTLRAILDAAAEEFGARGFHEAAIARIAQRADVAIGSFYTYFDSKEAVFRALVADMSAQVRETVAPVILAAPDRLAGERAGIAAFIAFVRQHQALYRIIDESAFVAEDAYRKHYTDIAEGYAASLTAAFGRGELSDGDMTVRAWAIMGMNVFLGLRFGVWDQSQSPEAVADAAAALIGDGLRSRL